jgi:hypothetical protein
MVYPLVIEFVERGWKIIWKWISASQRKKSAPSFFGDVQLAKTVSKCFQVFPGPRCFQDGIDDVIFPDLPDFVR